MTIDNLASGLIGGVIGGLLGLTGGVVLAVEQRGRWRRENKAAAVLVGSEITFNLYYLDKVKTDALAMAPLVTMAAWEAERVKVASFLSLDDLRTVGAAYVRVGAFVVSHRSTAPEVFVLYHRSPAGREAIELMMKDLIAAERVLRLSTGQTVGTSAGRPGWLGVSGGGLVRL